MDLKEIDNTLRNIFEKWIDGIVIQQVRDHLRDHTYISGGCIASLVLDETPNDYDLYFTDDVALKMAVDYYADTGRGAVANVSKNAILLRTKIHLVTKLCGAPDQVIAQFDFKHTRASWSPQNGLASPFTLSLINNKKLEYLGSPNAISSFYRAIKFIARGWTISRGDLIKIAMDIADLTDNYVEDFY